MNILKSAIWANKCHEEVNHRYGPFPYAVHLDMAANYGTTYSNLIDGSKQDKENVISAIWCHDVIEDARQTYNDVKKATNKKVADLVYAVTNLKGRTRDERASNEYYMGIRSEQYATFVKLCDRLANVEYSLAEKERAEEKGRTSPFKFQRFPSPTEIVEFHHIPQKTMWEKYRDEHENFQIQLWDPQYLPMFNKIRLLLQMDPIESRIPLFTNNNAPQ